ncbi:type II toxin-antitoxin system Phd/YefM family antitoxin [Thalassospira lohafexi]|uniref:Antitoxin n=1 Tax=Thalassospira lohafexi TaxID=744227 RepID=A0A2N3L6G8_9PROT|nr:type II toxin-antitoxin system Phd/YefM family antitoxin [Thalassospira lohafexi]PKR58429.1 prevent-host-death protein [Thalassospira lohafexi]
MDITKDIRPLTEFKRDTVAFTKRLQETQQPTVLTVNGKASLVVMDAKAWQDMQNRLEYNDAVDGIRTGLHQIADQKGEDANSFFDNLTNRDG